MDIRVVSAEFSSVEEQNACLGFFPACMDLLFLCNFHEFSPLFSSCYVPPQLASDDGSFKTCYLIIKEKGWDDRTDMLICSIWHVFHKAQLIHDRNTASHSAMNEKTSGTASDRVHMTWTKDKLINERNKHREGMAVKDMFNMKP